MERHGGDEDMRILSSFCHFLQSWIQVSGILMLVVKVGEFSHLNEPNREILLNTC